MTFSVVIPTYFRKDGKSKLFLERALNSVFNQTYKDFKIILIGDRYENEEEIHSLVDKYPKEKIYFYNLLIAKERDRHSDKNALWSYGGVNATNHGINISLNMGIDFICHLDHDDFWNSNHLQELYNCYNQTHFDWACTKSLYIRGLIYPTKKCEEKYNVYLPQPQALIHSSVCMNFKKIPLKYEDLYDKNGIVGLPSDADLWVRTSDYIKKNNLTSILINEVTCNHIEEGYERIQK